MHLWPHHRPLNDAVSLVPIEPESLCGRAMASSVCRTGKLHQDPDLCSSKILYLLTVMADRLKMPEPKERG